MNKHFSKEIRKYWAKRWISGLPKSEIASEFTLKNKARYLQRNNGDMTIVIKRVWPVLISWHRIYNLGMSEKKKKEWIPQIDITQLDDRDKELFNEFINDLLGPRGVSQDDVAAAIAKLKEKAKGKQKFARACNVSRKLFYLKGKEGIVWKPGALLTSLLQQTFETSRRVYGYAEIFWYLVKKHIWITIWNVRKTCEKLGLKSLSYRHKRRNPLEQKYTGHHQPDLLTRSFKKREVMGSLCTDVTHRRLRNGQRAYVSAFIDARSAFIVASSVGKKNDVGLVMDGIKQIESAALKPNLIHSDNALTYLSEPYLAACKRLGINRSYCPPGDSLANRPIEYLWNIWKREGCGKQRSENLSQLRDAWTSFLNWYNESRIQSQFEWKSPKQFLLSLE